MTLSNYVIPFSSSDMLQCIKQIYIYLLTLEISMCIYIYVYIHIHSNDGLMQERRNSIANALELHLSCTNPSICHLPYFPLLLLPSPPLGRFFGPLHPAISLSTCTYISPIDLAARGRPAQIDLLNGPSAIRCLPKTPTKMYSLSV